MNPLGWWQQPQKISYSQRMFLYNLWHIYSILISAIVAEHEFLRSLGNRCSIGCISRTWAIKRNKPKRSNHASHWTGSYGTNTKCWLLLKTGSNLCPVRYVVPSTRTRCVESLASEPGPPESWSHELSFEHTYCTVVSVCVLPGWFHQFRFLFWQTAEISWQIDDPLYLGHFSPAKKYSGRRTTEIRSG